VSDKPKDMISNLGVDVELESEPMKPDKQNNERLRAIGKEMLRPQIEAGMEYVGSFAFHMVVEKNTLSKTKYSIASITQIAIDDVSEQLATLAFNNGVIALRKYFNPAVKTGRRGDKR
jgi:hypothetical protein